MNEELKAEEISQVDGGQVALDLAERVDETNEPNVAAENAGDHDEDQKVQQAYRSA